MYKFWDVLLPVQMTSLMPFPNLTWLICTLPNVVFNVALECACVHGFWAVWRGGHMCINMIILLNLGEVWECSLCGVILYL